LVPAAQQTVAETHDSASNVSVAGSVPYPCQDLPALVLIRAAWPM
jgi:hypothetical protein